MMASLLTVLFWNGIPVPSNNFIFGASSMGLKINPYPSRDVITLLYISLPWASMAVAHLRPRKTRGAIKQGSSLGQQTMGFSR
ncbi:hypothetical protein Y032_0248g75 [Ancylostoma ceylanicum]|nr:hypothetical protein Y032_0248g75 [Ancylostoma ceylanicum]